MPWPRFAVRFPTFVDVLHINSQSFIKKIYDFTCYQLLYKKLKLNPLSANPQNDQMHSNNWSAKAD